MTGPPRRCRGHRSRYTYADNHEAMEFLHAIPVWPANRLAVASGNADRL
jgi:hypothetical protein